jgi:mannose-1-phosphate guanylyltransferase/mannose-1-phosphate guanylyltransferase/phosphomannomutase
MGNIRKAFVLGAGLGTRLRPLTETVPKPMIPVWNKPLITYAFDHLITDAGVESIMVNTHHCPEVYDEVFPDGRYNGAALAFRHEPVLLDTAGGIANIADWLPDKEESFLVYNGDILTDLPLASALEAHEKSGALATMILRSEGQGRNVVWEESTGRIVDLRDALGTGGELPRYQFTGIYLVRPAFLKKLTPGKIESVILPFLDVIREGGIIGGVVIDDGSWSDLGDRESYLDASVALAANAGFPRYGRNAAMRRMALSAKTDPTASVDETSVVGEDCRIGPGAEIRDSILWSGCRIESRARLTRCIIREGACVEGEATDQDF